ncbi:MAG TPA: YebC/PmpR family DNA-binding transcriptional regulator [Thermoanaerobaculia bacterium]|jgi:YebC/PmpR family DNA-binding regulatory protein|nr:YebC/PmpR family DNA-binding transcriptional regulator [Thermoanaerobaculia bacterium]
MSGHSKWSTIKHKKAATDLRRGKVFSKILKEITVAARLGGGDPKGNPRLRTALLEARSNSVPGDNIERAIKKGTGELEGEAYEEITYEGFGPAGVAILVEVTTDNRNRTAPEIRHLFTKHGGTMAEAGSVGWQFKRRGWFEIESGAMTEEQLMELALELGVDDVSVEEGRYELVTAPEDFNTVQEALEARSVPLAAKELAMLPQTTVDVPAERINQVLRLMEALEDHDDVQKVWANFNIDENVLAAASR